MDRNADPIEVYLSGLRSLSEALQLLVERARDKRVEAFLGSTGEEHYEMDCCEEAPENDHE
jgi:hypothetical protein